MAETQTTVALNIGSQRIGMAIFEVSKSGGLILKAYDSESIVADPALDASRVSQTRVAIADLANRLKTGKTKARYAISGQAVFTRFVKLPPLQDDNIEQLVTFEAQQHVPFPINEVIWDYELIEGSDEKEVVIVAIKGDALDEINSAVNDSGLGTAEVDVAPMALYNAFRSAYGTPEEPVLLIDIGAKTSNLLYIEGRRFFTRSIPIGGSAVSAAIAKEYGISFLEAEHQKVSNGLVTLGGGHADQLDEAVAGLAMVIRNALTRLPAEIARTTNYYRSQHGGNAPRRVILAGGGANLPYTLEFFQEKLNLPVEFFNPVRNITLGKGIDAERIQREAHLMGELIGLGQRGIGKSAINIDLVPAVVEESRAADRRKPFLIGAAAVIIGGVGLWAALQFVAAGKAREKARMMDNTRESLAPIHASISDLLKREQSLNEIASQYTSAESDHTFWFDLIADLRGAFAHDSVWITDFVPLHGYNPLPPEGAAPAGGTTNGAPVVKAELAALAYGTTGLTDIRVEPQGGRSGRAQAEPAVPSANAVRLRGFWRQNAAGPNVVSNLLTKLRENPGGFSFTVPAERGGEPAVLSDQQLIKRLDVTGGEDDLAYQFEIILPLARPVPVQ